jgi:hypothetical protein
MFIYYPPKLTPNDDWADWYEKFNKSCDSLKEVSETYGDIDEFEGLTLREYLDKQLKYQKQSLVGLVIAMS